MFWLIYWNQIHKSKRWPLLHYYSYCSNNSIWNKYIWCKTKRIENDSNIYLWLISQTVQPRQFRQFGEAPVIDTEVQVFIQDTEVLVAAFYNPTTTLQEYDTELSDNKKCGDLKYEETFQLCHCFCWALTRCALKHNSSMAANYNNTLGPSAGKDRKRLVKIIIKIKKDR